MIHHYNHYILPEKDPTLQEFKTILPLASARELRDYADRLLSRLTVVEISTFAHEYFFNLLDVNRRKVIRICRDFQSGPFHWSLESVRSYRNGR